MCHIARFRRGGLFTGLIEFLQGAARQDDLLHGPALRQPGIEQMPAVEHGLTAAAALACRFEQCAQLLQARIGGRADIDGGMPAMAQAVGKRLKKISHVAIFPC